MTSLLASAASGQTPGNSQDLQPAANINPSTGAAPPAFKPVDPNAAIRDMLKQMNSGKVSVPQNNLPPFSAAPEQQQFKTQTSVQQDPVPIPNLIDSKTRTSNVPKPIQPFGPKGNDRSTKRQQMPNQKKPKQQRPKPQPGRRPQQRPQQMNQQRPQRQPMPTSQTNPRSRTSQAQRPILPPSLQGIPQQNPQQRQNTNQQLPQPPSPTSGGPSQADLMQMILGGGPQLGGAGDMAAMAAMMGGGGSPDLTAALLGGGAAGLPGQSNMAGLGLPGQANMAGLAALLGGGAGSAPGAGEGLGALGAMMGAAGATGAAGARHPLLGGAAGAKGAGMSTAGMMANMLNPMGPGRPLIKGMTANQVSDLMGGQKGPVPMDIANEAKFLHDFRKMRIDDIVDILGDKLQSRRNQRRSYAKLLAANALSGGGMNFGAGGLNAGTQTGAMG